jgi:hypothetical protein
VEALRASTIAAHNNPLAVRPAASQQSDSAVIGPTGHARLGLVVNTGLFFPDFTGLRFPLFHVN